MNEVKVFSEATQYIKIAVGEEFYGVDISVIENIVRMQRITRVPNVAAYIKGVINLRGEIVPIMNLRLKIGLEEIEYTKDTRIIIIKTENYGKIGLIVDAVKEVVALEEDQLEKLPYDNTEENHFVSAVGKVDNTLVSVLDLGVVLYDKQSKEES
ncbi:MAG: chemotaxis protein CheW [Lachnospiraceae bacterium]|jgi:purine-binding chemotaxis protein CheW|nr:chemotaxis protein CheW [Lachnospiraceae bacterium]MBP5414427.1 chemotaxis protein CheW [Lachnospiraceae bacterium]MBP5746350.1 chemotaxis protein CheW [Lachnospiraceae bacterium]MBR6148872.1 chemotaxis protein CheW [Lachnospiraceae bacterium]